MRKKFIKNTYLLGVDEYEINMRKDDKKNAYIVVKYIKDIHYPYIENHTGKHICLLNDGYYIVEYIPIDENYVVHVFLNEKMEVQQYKIDITKSNGYKGDSPFYLSLCLNITIDVQDDNRVIVWNEKELEEAKNKEEISQEDFKMVYTVLKKLLSEINKNKNFYINENHRKNIQQILKKECYY